MARDDNSISQSSNQTTLEQQPQGYQVPPALSQVPFQPPPQGYPNHHDNPLAPQPAQEAYVADNQQSIRSYVPEQTEQAQPPPQAYKPESYPPHQSPAAYPPQAQPEAYPQPQQEPAAYPPQAQPVAYPPQEQPAPYTHHQQPNGACYTNPQAHASYTPNNIYAQPQAVSYNGAVGYQPQVITGTPTWQQPAMNVQGWSTGLLECFDDPENAILTFLFPCVTFGQIAEIADNGQTSCATSGLMYSLILSCIGVPCIMSCGYRTKIRARFNLLETPAPDWVIHLFCEYCALCQEYRELKNRGLDPAIGWQGNLSRQQQMSNCATMTPPMNQRMMG